MSENTLPPSKPFKPYPTLPEQVKGRIMSVMHFNDLFDLIDEALPGQRLWMQCVPVQDDDSTTEEGVGLAIQKESLQKESSPHKKSYSPIFFSVVPKNEALDDSGTLLPGRGEDATDWNVEIGYQEQFGTLAEAIDEAKVLARGLPMSPIFRTEERRAAILDAVTDPEDFDDQDPDEPDPDIGPRTGQNQVIRQELLRPDPHTSENEQKNSL